MDERALREQLGSAIFETLPPDLRAELARWAHKSESISFDLTTALNGSLQDYQTAENLYQSDREVESLRILDRVLGIQQFLRTDMPRLSSSFRSHRHSFVVGVTLTGFGGNTAYEIQLTQLGPHMIQPLLNLRGRCLVALLSDSTKRTAELFAQAVDHAESTFAEFPEDIGTLNLAAQVHFIEGDYRKTKELIEQSISLNPNHPQTRKTQELFRRGMERDSYSGMTFRAIEMIRRVVYELAQERSEVAMTLRDRAEHLLDESLSLSEPQADAWAAKAWLHLLAPGPGTEHDQIALNAFARARQLDARRYLVKFVEGLLRSTGRFH